MESLRELTFISSYAWFYASLFKKNYSFNRLLNCKDMLVSLVSDGIVFFDSFINVCWLCMQTDISILMVMKTGI